MLHRFRSIPLALVGAAFLAAGPGLPASAGTQAIAGSSATARYIVTLRGLAPAIRATARSATAEAGRARTAEAARVGQVDRAVTSVAQRHGIAAGPRYHYALQGFAASLTPAQVRALQNDRSVGSLTRVRPVQPAGEVVPTGIARVGASPGTTPAPARLGDVNVAVLDTGIRHLAGGDPELNVAGKGIDCANDADKGGTGPAAWADVDANNGHGTHVAGTIGARDSGSGIVGVAPGVRLFAVRIFASQGGGVTGDTETVACGVDWVASTRSADPPTFSQPIDVANMSIQGGRSIGDAATCPAPGSGDAEHDAICRATALGITFVVAAGNSGRDAAGTVPAAYDSVISVSALSDYDGAPGGNAPATGCSGDRDDSFASYSNYGASVDLIAPGSCIKSLSQAAGETHSMSGTSMATPHVTGAAARYVAMQFADQIPRSAIDVGKVRTALRATANFGWSTATDPDHNPDRLLDVAALQSNAPNVNLWAFPGLATSKAPTSGDTTETDFAVELQRVGLYGGSVSIAATTAAAGVTIDPIADLTGIGGVSAALHVNVGPDAVDGDAIIHVTATPSGGLASHSADVTLRIDRHPPTIDKFTAALVDHVQFANAEPVRLSWSGSDPGGSIVRYEMQRRVAPSTDWSVVGISPQTSTNTVRLVAPKTDYSFRVRAIDAAGNQGEWTQLDLRLGIRDSSKPSITFSSANSWSTRSKSTAYGGSFRRATASGAFAGVTFRGRSIAWIAPTGPGKGTARVQIDKAAPVTVSQSASKLHAQQVIWASGVLPPGPHQIVITVLSGTIDVDAILILS